MAPSIPPPVLHLVRTACLVESRAHLYSEYLARVFAPRGPRWVAAFEQWGAEEATHGQSLRALLAEVDPLFDFEGRFAHYLGRVAYHPAAPGESVYGSHQAELVARCIVEAMAATYYQALATGAEQVRPLCLRLAADEARHFTMFRRLLEALREEEGPRPLEALGVVVRRLLALNDEHLLVASWLAGETAEPFQRGLESKRYRAMVWAVYRPRHLRFAAALALQTLGLKRPAPWVGWMGEGFTRVVRAATR